MKRNLLSLLLALAMLLSLLCGCGVSAGTDHTESTGGGDTTVSIPKDTSAAPPEQTSAATEPPAPVIEDAVIVSGGTTRYDLIISEDAGTESEEMSLARSIVDQLQTLTSASAQVKTDWVRTGAEHDSTTYEILIGNTAYPETAQVAQTIGYGDYAIRAVGNKIVIFAYSDAVLQVAVSRFNSMLNACADRSAKTIVIEGKMLNQAVTVNAKLGALPLFEGGEFSAYYEAGADCDEIIIRSTTLEQYRQYLTTVAESGYTQYTTHQMANNHFATYTNSKYTLTAGYYDYEDSVRLLIEPLAPAVGLESENVYTPVTTSQITMLGSAYNANGSYAANGLSVLIRLTDGRFVIVDGGHSYIGCARELRDALREQSAAYAASDREITIAAWIITHAHGDHHGAFNSNYQLFRNMKVERVLVNYLSETERLKAVNSTAYSANWGKTEGKGDSTIAAAKALGAQVHQVHVGQVYYLADLKMEILYTIESFAPNICNALNTTSTVMRMEFGGETVYLSTGDATGNGMEICSDMYGDYLQSDIVQVCHHGYSTWGNDAGMIKAYKTVNAPTLLWPQQYSAYLTSRTKEYNHVLFTVPNFKEVLVSGSVGDQVIVPIPYQVGEGRVIRAAQ